MILDILRPSPQMKILLIGSGLNELVELFGDFISPHNGVMDIYSYDESIFTHNSISKCTTITNYPPFGSREYEYVIAKDIPTDIKLLKLLYRSMENSAEIIMLHKSNHDLNIEELLESCEFRTPNTIYGIYKDLEITVAKKLHMWGNGL
jgi:hypothetical protein